MVQSGNFTAEALQKHINYASALQETTRYNDEDIMSVQKSIAYYGIAGDQLDKLTKATIDFAVAKGVDLVSAGNLVAKAVGTETDALKRYGVEISGAAGSTERAQNAAESISRLFGGSAAADAGTFSGKLAILKNSFDELKEAVGNAIIKNQGLSDIFGIVKKAIEDATKYVKLHQTELSNLVKDGIVYTIQTFGLLVKTLDLVDAAITKTGNTMVKTGGFFADIANGVMKYLHIGDRLARQTMDYSAAASEEIAATNKQREARAALMDLIIQKSMEMAGAVAVANTTIQTSEAETAELTAAAIENGIARKVAAYQELSDKVIGYTDTEYQAYETQRKLLEDYVQAGIITRTQYNDWILANGKKFNTEEQKNLVNFNTMWSAAWNQAVAVTGKAADEMIKENKTFGEVWVTSTKEAIRGYLDAMIDGFIKGLEAKVTAEIGAAAIGGALSFGLTLLAIPAIVAAGIAAKAAVRAVVGYDTGGIVGRGGEKLPLPSFESAGAGSPAIIMAHEGEAVGMPSTLAAAGIGGMTINVNIAGGINSMLDIEFIASELAARTREKIRSGI
jgi:hypothetical protein